MTPSGFLLDRWLDSGNLCTSALARARGSFAATGHIVLDGFLVPHVAARAASFLECGASFRRIDGDIPARARRGLDRGHELADEPVYRMGVLEDAPPRGFDLDRLWFNELCTVLTSAEFACCLDNLTGSRSGVPAEVGAHQLQSRDAVAPHRDDWRDLVFAIFLSRDWTPRCGGEWRMLDGSAWTRVAPRYNRFVAWAGDRVHAVDPVRGDGSGWVRRNIVGWRGRR
jgi:hypothetical protein